MFILDNKKLLNFLELKNVFLNYISIKHYYVMINKSCFPHTQKNANGCLQTLNDLLNK